MSNTTTVISTEKNTGFMNFPSRGEVVAQIGERFYHSDVSEHSQLPLPSALVWKDGAGNVVDISFQTAFFFR